MIKLTVYLFKEHVRDFRGLIYERYLEGDNPYVPAVPVVDLDFECAAYAQANKAKAPRWVDFLGLAFNVRCLSLANTSNSFVILVRRSSRVLAFTFGYAYNAVDRSKIEPGFGLRTTLNAIEPNSLNTIDIRNIDLVTRQSRIHLNVGSPIHEFEINIAVDWVRSASGRPENDEFSGRMSGADSLQVSLDCTVCQLGKVADELLRLHSATTYKERFPFVDSLVRVGKDDPDAENLDAELLQMLEARTTTRVAIAHPEIPHPDTAYYKIFSGRMSTETTEIDLSTVYQFLDQNPVSNPLMDVYAIAMDASDQPKSQKRRLGDFLVCEIDRADCRYVLSLGSWFKVAADFIAQVRESVSHLPDLTEQLSLPPIRRGEHEGDYNERVAAARQWLLLDKRPFTFSTYTERIEACDIVTDTGILMAVKKMRSSATLSHLFAQGSVSARLLKTNTTYAESFLSQLRAKWPERDYDLTKLQFLYAIPTEKRGPIADCLFFFSMINLMEHVQRIRLAGFDVGLCKIGYEDASPS